VISQAVTIEPITASQWAELSTQFSDHNYRQAWAFAVACANRLGASSNHVAIRRGSDLLGITDVRVKPLPLLPGGIAYINGGPLVRSEKGHDLEHLEECLLALRRDYVQQQQLVLRALAPIGEPSWNAAADRKFEELGFRKTDRGRNYRTFLLDITRPTEEIRAGLHQKWRNCLNSAERNSLEVQSGTSDDLLERFCSLFGEFLARKGFDLDLSAEFYSDVQHEHLHDERYFVSLAVQDGDTVAGHVSSMNGNTCVYLLGATHPIGLKSKAAYLLQWHTILAAQEHGLRWYDLGGIDPEGNPGVHRFKKGLNGIEVQAAGPYEIAPNGPMRHLINVAESSYQTFKALRAKLSLIKGSLPHRTPAGNE
jgi:hypothetical protein